MKIIQRKDIRLQFIGYFNNLLIKFAELIEKLFNNKSHKLSVPERTHKNLT